MLNGSRFKWYKTAEKIPEDPTTQDPNERVKIEKLMTDDETYDLTEYQKQCTRAYESLIPPEFETKDPTLELFLGH